MRILLYLSIMLLCSVLLLFVLDRLSAPAPGRRADASDCRPHLYLSGIVEVRGKPGEVYLLEYRNLPELARMLQAVEADMKGEMKWMGTD